MMLMEGNNHIELNQATINNIVSQWYNAHTIHSVLGAARVEFVRFDQNTLHFKITYKEPT